MTFVDALKKSALAALVYAVLFPTLFVLVNQLYGDEVSVTQIYILVIIGGGLFWFFLASTLWNKGKSK